MNIAVVLAGGQGLRMGNALPKQFIPVEDKPLLIHTLEAFERHPLIDQICVVCLPDWQETLQKELKRWGLRKVAWLVGGGATRRESSWIAVELLSQTGSPEDVILLHDGARPLVSERIISENIACAKQFGACETVIPSQDTVVISEDGQWISSLPERRTIYQVQTPQSFLLQEIYDAHRQYQDCAVQMETPDITDDAGLLLFAGRKVAFVPGEKQNLKVTTQEDLLFVQTALLGRGGKK